MIWTKDIDSDATDKLATDSLVIDNSQIVGTDRGHCSDKYL